jgi:hypothetical protein
MVHYGTQQAGGKLENSIAGCAHRTRLISINFDAPL